MQEVWKDIPGYEGLYQVSSLGRVKSLERDTKRLRPQHIRERMLKPRNGGYLQVYLADAGKREAVYIHRLVAQAFIPNPDNKPIANHKDGNKHNNSVENLEWCTHQENVLHAYLTGLNIPHQERKGVWTIQIEQDCDKFKIIKREFTPK